MKRPLALFSFAFLCASAVVSRFVSQYAAWSIGIVTIVLVAIVLIARLFFTRSVWIGRAVVVLVAVNIAIALGAIRLERAAEFSMQFAGRVVNAEMTVTDSERLDSNYYRITARIDSVEGERAGFETMFYSSDGAIAYDKITARAKFQPNGTQRFTALLEDGFTVVGQGPKLMRFFADVRRGISVALSFGVGGEEGALGVAMTIGDKSLIPARTMSAFYRSGASHILVVSGLHLSAILNALMWLVCRISMPRWMRYSIMLLGCAFIVLTVGFSPSVLRAGIMAAVAYIAYMNRETADGLTSLMFAALIIVGINQAAVFELSFLLSFACTFALIVIVPSVSQRVILRRKLPLTGIPRWLLHTALSSVCIWAACAPVLLLFGRPVSLVGTIANLLVLWIMYPALILCLFSAASFWLFGGAVTAVFAFLTRCVIWYIKTVCRLVAAIPFSSLDTSQSWLKVYAVCVIIMFAVAFIMYGRNLPWLRVSVCCVIILLAGFGTRKIINAGDAHISIVSGATLSVVLYGDDGGIMCVDDVTADKARDYALLHGLKVKYLVSADEGEYSREVFEDSTVLNSGYADITRGSFTVPLREGEAEFFIREGLCEYVLARLKDRTVLITLECEYLPADLEKCELIIITRDAPKDLTRYRGAVISGVDVVGARRPEYGDYLEIYIRPQGRIRVQS